MQSAATQSSLHVALRVGHVPNKNAQPLTTLITPHSIGPRQHTGKTGLKELPNKTFGRMPGSSKTYCLMEAECAFLHCTPSPLPMRLSPHETAQKKVAVLKETFFPPKLHHLPPYLGDSEPPPTPLPFSTLPLSTVHCCIKKLHPFKAPGPDGIPNVVLKCTSEVLVPLLHASVAATPTISRLVVVVESRLRLY